MAENAFAERILTQWALRREFDAEASETLRALNAMLAVNKSKRDRAEAVLRDFERAEEGGGGGA